jgi:hypothetical protein
MIHCHFYIWGVILALTVYNMYTTLKHNGIRLQCVGPTLLCLGAVHLLYTVSISIIFPFFLYNFLLLCLCSKVVSYYFLSFKNKIKWGATLPYKQGDKKLYKMVAINHFEKYSCTITLYNFCTTQDTWVRPM